jgi:hypothetical protein
LQIGNSLLHDLLEILVVQTWHVRITLNGFQTSKTNSQKERKKETGKQKFSLNKTAATSQSSSHHTDAKVR